MNLLKLVCSILFFSVFVISGHTQVDESTSSDFKEPFSNGYHDLNIIYERLQDSISVEDKIELLIQERRWWISNEERKREQAAAQLEERTKKCIQLIRIIYEKTLDLDHYYSSTATFQDISAISNPNNYDEFQDLIKELNRARPGKQIEMPDLLNSNIYAALIQKFVMMFSGNNKNTDQIEEKLKKAECVLDLSLNLTNNLNVIYYESEFLRNNNLQLIDQLGDRFSEFAELLGYEMSLEYCRENDDWENFYNKLAGHFNDLSNEGLNKQSDLIDVEFNISRMVSFIFSFKLSVESAKKYYEKFHFMLENYSNQDVCHENISGRLESLKVRISTMISKFEKAYFMAEIDGSILKAISYGSQH